MCLSNLRTLTPRFLQLIEREGQPIVAVEAFVTGNYVKCVMHFGRVLQCNMLLRYNNNHDWSDDRRNTPQVLRFLFTAPIISLNLHVVQAFSHWTWEHSHHQLMIVDIQVCRAPKPNLPPISHALCCAFSSPALSPDVAVVQGVGDVWTDPQFHTAVRCSLPLPYPAVAPLRCVTCLLQHRCDDYGKGNLDQEGTVPPPPCLIHGHSHSAYASDVCLVHQASRRFSRSTAATLFASISASAAALSRNSAWAL